MLEPEHRFRPSARRLSEREARAVASGHFLAGRREFPARVAVTTLAGCAPKSIHAQIVRFLPESSEAVRNGDAVKKIADTAGDMDMSVTEILGFVAAILTTVSFVPQAIKVIRSRNTEGISLLMYTLFTAGMSLWLVYGLIIGSRPMIISNSITALLSAIILAMTFRNHLRKRA